MQAVVCEKAPCALKRGELRRVPINVNSRIIAYHVCCPRCGFVSIALEGDNWLLIDEDKNERVSFSKALECIYCRVKISIKANAIELEETPYVRSIRYN